MSEACTGPEAFLPADPGARSWPGTALEKLKTRLGGGRALRGFREGNLYERLSETDARDHVDEARPDDVDLAGQAQLLLLAREGLRPTDTILDFGCRTGRLAARIIPTLIDGHYIGIDLSDTMLARARLRVASVLGKPPCRVTWINQTSYVFPLANRSVDVLCAFSAFTQMEHEDTYRYLKSARRIVKPGGKLVLSCLPMELAVSRAAFLESANRPLSERWSRSRTFTTSSDMMVSIARLAGWHPTVWHKGREVNAKLAAEDTAVMVGATLVLLNPETKVAGAPVIS